MRATTTDGDSSASLTLPLAVHEFLTWLAVERGRSANTLEAYRRDLTRYCRYLADRATPVEAARPADVVEFVNELTAADLARSTVTRSLVALRGLHGFLAAEGLAASDPTTEVEVPRTGRGLPKPLDEDEVGALIDAVEGDQPLARRDRALLEVLYGTGARISEVVGLSMGDVDLDAALARVLGKGDKERVVPLGRLAVAAVAEWLEPEGRASVAPGRPRRRDDLDAVFLNARGGRLSRQGAWGVVRKYGLITGIADRLSPHVLRHSCATHMLDHGADIRTVQELLGHASVTTTQVYTRVSNEQLDRVYRMAHPRASHSGSAPADG